MEQYQLAEGSGTPKGSKGGYMEVRAAEQAERRDVQVFQQHLLKRPPWLHPLPLHFVKGQLTVFIGVSHVFGAGISLFSSSRKLLYFVHGPGGNGEFLELPSGSCYGNSSAGQEASVSILPAAKCPCPRWTWEWTGATAPPVPQPSL